MKSAASTIDARLGVTSIARAVGEKGKEIASRVMEAEPVRTVVETAKSVVDQTKTEIRAQTREEKLD